MENNKIAKCGGNQLQLSELYFLISKFLKNGPLQNAAKGVIEAMENYKILPKRMDWLGNQHDQTFEELESKYPHISPNHLYDICLRIGPILDKELNPSVPGVLSLLGAGKQSLLRTNETINRPKALRDYSTRLHGMPVIDTPHRKNPDNIVNVLYGRELSGPIIRKQAISTNFYTKQTLLRRTLGHLSAVYCVLFDRSGNYIITGADDLLVKLWSAIDGRLLLTFRGASAEITDIATNLDNTLLAAGSLDRILRVWDLQTGGPIAVLSSHTGMITSVNFCPQPKGDIKYLVTTSTDGTVAFWQYTTPRGAKPNFASKPIQYHEKIRPGQAQMICASYSPGGIFLAAGSADHHVRVYIMAEEGPKRILEIEAHTDTVDSIQWAHSGLQFISGSKDGIALVWHFESQQWKSMKLNMSERLPSCPPIPDDDVKRLKVTMVSWDYTDKWIITAVNDFTIKVWNALTGKLHKVMRGHTDELYVLESNPKDPHVLISAGHDGQMFIWDIYEGVPLANFLNHIDGQGHGGVFDAKWSPDGSMIAATDSHGHILMYGVGTGHDRLRMLPRELFFHTDYRPLIRDSNHFVMDEQTQTMPHLMPPPFLVDVDGNPYPPALQRLVPGRENCTNEQLIPNIAVGPEGVEVIEGAAAAGMAVSEIDRLIAALANRSGQPDPNNDRENLLNNLNNNRAYYSPRMSGSRVGLRRNGDLEGVRLSSGNWQHEHNYKWMRRTFIAPLNYSYLQASRQTAYVTGQQELELYRREMRRRPVMINTGNISLATARPPARRGRHGPNAITENSLIAHRTRARREQETRVEPNDEHDDPDNIASPSSDSDDSSDLTADIIGSGSSSSETDSSDYSDWVAADQPGNNLEPPKRLKRKPVHHRIYTQANHNNNNTNNNSNNTHNNINTSNNSNNNDNSNNNNNINNNEIENVTENGESSKRGRKKLPVPVPENGEIPEAYRPPEWLSEVIPRKAPYYPQMGDEVVYFRQGHQRYLEAVRNKNVYKLSNNIEPWHNLDLREHELVKVIGIKYEIRPPRLCCLKLALINTDGVLTGQSFTIKYHDIPDVLDFIVLRQTYDTAVRRLWTPGDRFRCMIDDGWWMGLIESRVALSSDFLNSLFMCFRIRWDNGEYEFMSPWDMEPIDQQRLPTEIGGAVPVLPEELRQTLYQPKQEEWPRGDRDASCRRIVSGLEEVMGLAIAEPFLAPVDLNCYPTYAFVVEYPIDLATIKSRFENHFYRRITSAQFDVRYLATNAEKFNESRSNIVRHARIITDLCLRIIKDHNEVNVQAVYHQLVDTYTDSDSDNDQTDGAGPSTSAGIGGVTRAARRSNRLKSDFNWRIKCRELLEMIYSCDDSSPFRNPVDIIEHPDYTQIVDTPMDLHTVKEDLLGGNYESPIEFAKDMRLIFTNSRNYNTNKRSKIYSMTIRMSALFETHIKQLIHDWKSTKHNSPKKIPVNAVDRPGFSKMATRAKAATTTTTTTTTQETTNTTTTTTNIKPKAKQKAKPKKKPKPRRRRPASPPARPWARHAIYTVHPGFPWEDTTSPEFIRDFRTNRFDPTRPISEQLRENPRNGDSNEESAEPDEDEEAVEGEEEEEEDDEEEEEEVNDDENVNLANSRNRSRGRPSKHNQSNGVSSSSAYLNSQPSTSHYARMQATRVQQSRHNNHNNSTSTNNSDSSTDSSTSETNSDDSDESRGIPIRSLGMGSRQRKRPARHSDSEDSYKPNKRTMGKPKKRGRKKQRKDKDNRHNKRSPVNGNGLRTPIRSNSSMLGRPRIGRPPLNRQHDQSEQSNGPTTPGRSAASGRLRLNDGHDLNYRDLPNDTDEQEQQQQQQQQTPTKKRRGRPKRHYTRASDESNSSGVPQKKTKRRYGKFNENEHNLSNNSNSRNNSNNIQSDMDEDGRPLRPTRSSRRRPLWNDDDDEEEEDEDNDVDVDNDEEDDERFNGRRRIAQPQQLSSQERLRNRQRGIQAGRTSEQSQESSHNVTTINNPYRPIRSSTRQHRQSPDDSDDDRTLSQISLDSRTRRSFHSTSVINGISDEIPSTSRTITQTTAITGLSSESSSSSSTQQQQQQQQQRIQRSQVAGHQDDNDYGEPGPSSLRNATHELVDPIGGGSGMDLLSQTQNNISGRLRHRNHVNNLTTGMAESGATTTPTKSDKRRRYLRNVYTDEDENEEDPLPSGRDEMDKENSDNDDADADADADDDDYDTEGGNLKNIVDQIENGGGERDNPTSDDTSDPEDNKPLRYVATSTHTTKQTSEFHNTRSGRRTRKKPNVYMDNDDDDDYENGNNDDDDDDDYLEDGDDDDDDYNNNPNRNARRARGGRGIGGGPSTSSSARSTRIQKRPYYNEDTDDENPAPTLSTIKKRLINDTYADGETSSSRSRTATTTLTMLTTTTSTTATGAATQSISNHNIRPQRSTSNSNNTIDDENSDNEQLLSVSSRGRVRKITAKARGLFRE